MGLVHAFQIGHGLFDRRPGALSRPAALMKPGKRALAVVFNRSDLLCSRRRSSRGNVARNRGALC